MIARDAATSRGWWKTLGEMGERQRTYAELEAGAASIVEYQPAVVPGLLQTPAYARLRVAAGAVLAPEVDVDADVRARVLRQEVLRRVDPPRYTALLAEAACDLGDVPVAVWREQLRHLVALTGLANVTLRLLPRNAAGGPHPLTPYSCYAFPDPADPRTVMLEALTTDVRLAAAVDIDRYERMTQALLTAALSPEETVTALARRVGE